MDVVKQWLEPLFEPLMDVAYRAECQNHLVPEPAALATTSRTPAQTAPAPSPPGRVTEIQTRSQASIDRHATLRATTTRNNPGKAPSVATPPHRETDRPTSRRKRRGASLRDGGSGDAGKTSSY